MLFNSRTNFSPYLILVPFITSKNFPSNCQSENQTHLFSIFCLLSAMHSNFLHLYGYDHFPYHLSCHHSETFDNYNTHAYRLEKADFSILQLTCKIHEGLFYFSQELKLSIMERSWSKACCPSDNDEWLDSWGTGSLPLWPVLSNES